MFIFMNSKHLELQQQSLELLEIFRYEFDGFCSRNRSAAEIAEVASKPFNIGLFPKVFLQFLEFQRNKNGNSLQGTHSNL